MSKIWTIARKDILATFTDRNFLLIMLVTPLMISTIVALAFSGVVGATGSPITGIPVALVNLDQGVDEGFHAGGIFTSIFVPGESSSNSADMGACEAVVIQTGDGENTSLQELTTVTLLNDTDAARAGVEDGTYAAAIIIPADFSQRMTYTQDNPDIAPAAVEVYGDSARPISASIVRSITESITNQLLTGQITVAATIESMIERAQTNPAFGALFLAASSSGDFQPNFACAFTPGFNTIHISQQTVRGETPNFDPLVAIGSAQAMFFALFTAAGGAGDILEERRNGTLQRMIVSPTPRSHILAGKALGVLVMVLLQLLMLFAALSLVSSLLNGELRSIWGTDWLAIAALVLAAGLSVSGVGMLIGGLAKTNEQANIIGSIIALTMGVLGGAFFTVEAIPVIEPLTRLSVVRWGSEGFNRLAQGNTDIALNIAFLLVLGAALFSIGLWLFNRRQDI